ncbi:MAG TPA: glycerophosphodiester phosphodiesterase [bacterium]|nr:glycerophosphodiester phosphodiesterase [bacterium]
MIIRSEKKLIGGHRGSPKKHKENTILSFVQAIEDGADFIEFDVRRARDGNLVIHHDAEISGIALRTLKLSEINEIAIEKGYEVPVLEDVLRHCVNRIMLDVEIKEPDITGESVRQLLRYYSPDGFMITSFYDETLVALNSNHPGIKKGLLFDKNSNQDLEKRISVLKPDLLLPHYSSFNISVTELCTKFKLRTILWTVNSENEMKKFINDPLVAGIISDYPGIARKIQKN